jgi:hypothetical protein
LARKDFPAIEGTETAKHNTEAAAVARAIEAKPRLDILDFIGCFLAHFGRFLEVFLGRGPRMLAEPFDHGVALAGAGLVHNYITLGARALCGIWAGGRRRGPPQIPLAKLKSIYVDSQPTKPPGPPPGPPPRPQPPQPPPGSSSGRDRFEHHPKTEHEHHH